MVQFTFLLYNASIRPNVARNVLSLAPAIPGRRDGRPGPDYEIERVCASTLAHGFDRDVSAIDAEQR